MKPETSARILAWLLGVMGAMGMFAIIAVVMPTSWMDAGAEWTGVGPFPDTALTQYLARSLSALYVVFGALILYLAFNVRRYIDVIVVVGWLTIVMGLLLTGIDFAIGMPAHWSWSEGPPTVLIGGLFIVLARRTAAGSGS